MIAQPSELVTRFPFRGGNRAFANSKAKENLNCGPRGTGKSVAALYKLFIIAEKIPKASILLMRKTRASLTDSAMKTLEKHVLPPDHPALIGGRRENRHSYKFPNGSEIVLGGMGSAEERKKVLSTEWDLIYVNEATELREDEWEDLIPTLRSGPLSYKQLMADCNPEGPYHWLKRRCDRGDCMMHTSVHKDNPWLWDEERAEWTRAGIDYMDTLNRLTGVRRERYLLGRWVQAEGVVYDGWDQRSHLVAPFPIPREWKRIRCIDFGYTNPFVCLWIAVDGDGRAYVYRQLYKTKTLVEDHARLIRNHSLGEVITATVCDHDAEDRATLERYGIPTTAANKAIGIRPGIEVVEQALRPAGDGKPRLFVFRDSLIQRDSELDDAKLPFAIEQEFDCYEWPDRKPDKNSKELPVDKNNHAMDALRYGMTYLNMQTESTITSGGERASAGFRSW